MRIVGGTYKGRRIHAPKKLPVRPTTDRTREALFNMLTHHIDLSDKTVLDLFCGTGIISAEFQSRGVLFTTGVDRHRGCVTTYKNVMGDLGKADSSRGIKSDCLTFCKKIEEAWDLIFMDPPYDYPKITQLLKIIFERELLKPNGLCIVEHDPRRELSQEEHFLFSRVYGSSGLSFFQKKSET